MFVTRFKSLPRLALALPMVMALAVPAMAEGTTAVITVIGEGRVDAAPDMATISLGVTTQGANAAEAMAANSAKLAVVLESLRAAGIADRDLKTSGLSLNPNWRSSSNGNSEISGYIASNQLDVRVRDLDSLGAVLDAAVKDGANTLNGLNFGLSEPRPALDEARKRAVADARTRAKLLTEAAGVELGAIVSISEGSNSPSPLPMYRMQADAAEGAPPVAQGEISMETSVTMVWEVVQ